MSNKHVGVWRTVTNFWSMGISHSGPRKLWRGEETQLYAVYLRTVTLRSRGGSRQRPRGAALKSCVWQKARSGETATVTATAISRLGPASQWHRDGLPEPEHRGMPLSVAGRRRLAQSRLLRPPPATVPPARPGDAAAARLLSHRGLTGARRPENKLAGRPPAARRRRVVGSS